MSEWNERKECIPWPGDWVIVWDGVEVVKAYFYGDGGYFVRDNGDCLFKVTHWMPLPEPPQ